MQLHGTESVQDRATLPCNLVALRALPLPATALLTVVSRGSDTERVVTNSRDYRDRSKR